MRGTSNNEAATVVDVRDRSPGRARLLRWMAGLAMSLSLASCVSSGDRQPPGAGSSARRDSSDAASTKAATTPESQAIPSEVAAARSELAALARKQETAPAPAVEVAVPAGVDPQELAPAPSDAVSRRTLAEIIDSTPPIRNGEIATADVPGEARVEALRLYAQGRSKLLANDSAGAIADLESAVKLDPSSPEPLRALGEARLAAGKRMSSMDAYRRAVSMGLDDPRVFWQLGNDAEMAGDIEQAVAYYVASLRSRPEKSDPAMPYVVWMDLSDALVKRGSLEAAVEAIERAVSLPGQFGTSTRLRNELGELLRRRGDLLRRAGDLRCRLGDYSRGVETYEKAAMNGASDSASLWRRKTYALLRSGRTAEAALLSVAIASNARGVLEPTDIAMLKYTADASGLGATMDHAIAASSQTPTSLSNAARARAAVASPRDAVDILQHQLVTSPNDAPAAREFVELAIRSDRPSAVLRDAVTASPHSAASIARALQSRASSIDLFLASLANDRSSGAALLRGRLLVLIERSGDAIAALDGVSGHNEMSEAIALARIEAGMQRGDFPLVERSLATLDNAPFSVRARGFDLCGRRGEAKDMVERALTASESPQTLIDMASLSMSLGDAPTAEKSLHRAFELDPGEPRVYEGLISLYAASGPLASQEKLTEVARALRTTSPGSSLLRFLAAQELFQGGALQDAERLLRELAEEHPENDAVGVLLGNVWDRERANGQASLPQSEEWLRGLMDAHPEEPWPAIAMARLLVADGRADAASSLLAERWNTRPLRDYSLARERILREALKQTAEADEVEKERLARDSGTLSGSIEQAIGLLRRGDFGGAADAIRGPWPSWLALSSNASSALCGSIVAALGDKPVEQLANPGVMRVIDAAATLCPTLPATLHERRVQLIASADPVDLDAVRNAVERASREFPTGAHVFNARAAIGVARTMPKESLAFLRAAADYPAVGDDLLFELLRMTVLHGDDGDIDALIAAFKDPDRVRKLLGTAIKEPKVPTEPAKAQAELAYLLGNLCSSQGRDELSLHCYRTALRYDADHAWSMNNLGYAILEAGGDLAQSEALLSRAAELLPDEASVVDSLAWLRYHEGVLLDEAATNGAPARAGAVSLLKRAVLLTGGQKNSTLHDHLGDSLWRVGEKTAAGEAWKSALELARVDLRELSQSASTAARERLQKEFDAIADKLAAIDAGREPVVAPTTQR